MNEGPKLQEEDNANNQQVGPQRLPKNTQTNWVSRAISSVPHLGKTSLFLGTTLALAISGVTVGEQEVTALHVLKTFAMALGQVGGLFIFGQVGLRKLDKLKTKLRNKQEEKDLYSESFLESCDQLVVQYTIEKEAYLKAEKEIEEYQRTFELAKQESEEEVLLREMAFELDGIGNTRQEMQEEVFQTTSEEESEASQYLNELLSNAAAPLLPTPIYPPAYLVGMPTTVASSQPATPTVPSAYLVGMLSTTTTSSHVAAPTQANRQSLHSRRRRPPLPQRKNPLRVCRSKYQ